MLAYSTSSASTEPIWAVADGGGILVPASFRAVDESSSIATTG
jgi:hypothetical protein